PPPGSAEYLDSGGGRPIDPAPHPGGRGGLRKGLLVGGGVVGLAAVGVGAWAAVSFLATGPQPAEALPASTLAYLSVDLDPSGGQKIEALRTLNKFPAFEDEVGIDTDDDIRKAIFDEIQGELDCAGLDFEDDVEPWLGDRAAVAAVDSGGETPDPVFVLQVKDADAAGKGMQAIKDCAAGEGGDAEGGWSIEGDWAVIAQTDKIAETVTDDAAEGSLADDEDFQKWVGEAGDSGVLTMYAAPALGDYLAEHADDLFGFPFGALGVSDVDCAIAEPVLPPGEETLPGDDDAGGVDSCDSEGGYEGEVDSSQSMVSDELKQTLEDFKGMAGVLRFDDGSIEMEFASDGDVAGSNLLASDAGGDTITSLPEDTAAAIGVGFSEGWFADLLEMYQPYVAGLGEDLTLDDMVDELETQTGLTIPDDIETLFGDSAALALGTDFDPEALFESSDGSDVPVALKVDGDPEEIEAVLEKLRAQFPDEETLVFDTDAEGDTIVIGPNEAFRKQMLDDGGLGDNDVFKDVVREVDDASVVLFVNVNELEDLVEESMGEFDQELVDNVKPISGFGVSGYVDDGVAHSIMRLTTD
ncbi:DUF3352 domain-containing protein, partial [Nocardioides sp.]|uniref:DUF3352 domain-containing protein n=1 Tax=Nocardioides sp. TaxID=35761 RepID=UPI001A2A36EC